jgi:hypothetical protein
MYWFRSVKVCFYVFWGLSVSTGNGEGPGDCESGVFRAEKAHVVGGKKNQQMPQHFAVFGSQYPLRTVRPVYRTGISLHPRCCILYIFFFNKYKY